MAFARRLVVAGLGTLVAFGTVGCSTQKYQQQIDAQNAKLQGLEQKNYQLELALSQKQAQMDELARRPVMPPEGGRGISGAGEESTAFDLTPARRAAAPAAVDVGRLRARGLEVIEVDGCPAIVLGGDAFDLGKATLSRKGQEDLKKIAAVLRSDYAGHTFRIDGHTDNQPVKKHKDQYASNWELSSLRATAVAHFLIETGHIDGRQISTAAFADTRPRDTNNTPAGRQKNRRAEIVIVQ
ncbi:MAG: flagellar motor protein MotB [Planctomycetes bacterium]|nr:flagellar motor protein MotB [Planctomycetota bacterium]